MVYVPTKPRRGGQTPKPVTASPFTPMSPLPPESPKTTMIRICDNRLRMIRYWKILGNFRHIDLLRADLKLHIGMRKAESSKTDYVWFDRLRELTDAITDAKLSSDDVYKAVYAHIARPYPKHVHFSG